MLFVRSLKSNDGTFCRDCAQSLGRERQSLTLLTGWWGYISVIVNWGAVGRNVIGLRRAAKLGEPVGGNPSLRLAPENACCHSPKTSPTNTSPPQ